MLKIERVNEVNFEVCDVDIRSVLVWVTPEQHLHCCDTQDLELNVKLGGECTNDILYCRCFILNLRLSTMAFLHLKAKAVCYCQ